MRTLALLPCALLTACASLNYTPPVIPASAPAATVSYHAIYDEDMQLTTNSTCQPRSYFGRKDVYSMGHALHYVPNSDSMYRVTVEANKPFVASGFKKLLVGYETRWEWHNGFMMPEEYPIYRAASIMPMVFTPKQGHNYLLGLQHTPGTVSANITIQDLGVSESPITSLSSIAPVTEEQHLTPAIQCPRK